MAHPPFQRNTRQRQLILEELRKLSSHPTAVGLYEIVRRRLPRISLGTVYRNLELLSQAGLIRRLEFTGAESRFDGNPGPHDHLRCIGCGRVDDIDELPLELPLANDDGPGGFEILGRRLELLGLCPACQCRPSENPPPDRGSDRTRPRKPPVRKGSSRSLPHHPA